MDSALLLDAITVFSANGRRIAGASASADGERTWRFTPAAAWSKTEYRVIFDSNLEDVCGNRIGEALDHEVGIKTSRDEFTLLFRAR